MNSIYTGEIKIGDLIIISSGNYLEIGFYVGRGQNDSVQYYHLSELNWWIKRLKEPNPPKRKLPYVSHINVIHPTRIAKYDVNLLTNEYKEIYEKGIELLKLNK